jgi:hypothetical protein
MSFKLFLESDEKDLKGTLKKLPKLHAALVKKYNFKFEKGNTLNKSGEHVGEIDEKKNKITVAAPWRYGREFTVLHEIAHAVYKYLVDKNLRKEWAKIVKGTKDKQDQNDEELFAMAYANTYAHHKIEIHNHPEWESFIKKLPS